VRKRNSAANAKKTAEVKGVKDAAPAATIQNSATDPGYKIGPQD